MISIDAFLKVILGLMLLAQLMLLIILIYSSVKTHIEERRFNKIAADTLLKLSNTITDVDKVITEETSTDVDKVITEEATTDTESKPLKATVSKGSKPTTKNKK